MSLICGLISLAWSHARLATALPSSQCPFISLTSASEVCISLSDERPSFYRMCTPPTKVRGNKNECAFQSVLVGSSYCLLSPMVYLPALSSCLPVDLKLQHLIDIKTIALASSYNAYGQVPVTSIYIYSLCKTPQQWLDLTKLGERKPCTEAESHGQ